MEVRDDGQAKRLWSQERVVASNEAMEVKESVERCAPLARRHRIDAVEQYSDGAWALQFVKGARVSDPTLQTICATLVVDQCDLEMVLRGKEEVCRSRMDPLRGHWYRSRTAKLIRHWHEEISRRKRSGYLFLLSS